MHIALDGQATSRPAYDPDPPSPSTSLNSLYDRRVPHRQHISVTVRKETDVPNDHAATSPILPANSDTVTSRTGRRFTTCGFLPMPPISASPICTPTTSTSSRTTYGDDLASSSSGTDEFTTAPPTPPDKGLALRLHPSLPTWISIPPTPPPKVFRRSVTCVARRPPRTYMSVGPSASFPASATQPDGPKRRASVPVMPSGSWAATEASISKHKVNKKNTAGPIVGSPLRPLTARSRPVFAISHHVDSDDEDGNSNGEAETRSDHPSYAIKQKDDIRKYFALMELLSTEVRYLHDLRALVSVFIRQLPTVTARPSGSAFSRNSSFTTAPRTQSYASLHGPHSISSSDLLGSQAIPAEKKEKYNSRYLFTTAEIDVLTRNGEEILQLHEQLVDEVRAVMVPLGFDMGLDEVSQIMPPPPEALSNLENALSYIATKFATESSRFNIYEPFCAGHPEALDLIRRVQHSHGVEWEAFEQRCAALIYDMFGAEQNSPTGDSGEASSDSHPDSSCSGSHANKPRPVSMSSVDASGWTLRSRPGIGTKESHNSETAPSTRERKRCMDYMIMPMQRICRYPLLLDQLKTGKAVLETPPPLPPPRSNVNIIVQSSAQAMRHVASRVDEARHRRDVALQSSLIVSRILRSTPSAPPTQTRGQTLQVITPSFLASLGACLLAGSLDVMHSITARPQSIAGNITAKYLGAFLYLGGYLILVKVKSKTYEPRYWFRLADFELVEAEDDALLPCSFMLRGKGHDFELAAACQREKDVWLSSFQEAKSHPRQEWINEPQSSLHVSSKHEPPAGQETVLDPITAAQLVSEPRPHAYPELTESLLAALATDPNPTSIPARPPAPSRRSSTASVKAILHPMNAVTQDTIIIRRSSASARHAVDQGLRDVTSEPCLTARSHASSREEELFQAPSITRSGAPARSQTGLGLRLKKHESVRVRRRKSILEPELSAGTQPQTSPKKSASRAKSLTLKKRTQKNSLTSVNSDGECIIYIPPSDQSSFTQSPASITMSYPSSAMNSPTQPTSAREASVSPARRPERPRTPSRPSSLVNMFRSRPPSPVRGMTPIRNTKPPPSPPKKEKHGGALSAKPSTSSFKMWMKKGPFHRRSQSAPEDPPSEPPPSEPLDQSPQLPELSFGANLQLTTLSP
ncbi:Dbl homology domain-containing protein [Cylindrobasidium torrendii FP15055 ss-10]|uniref:Dbl homology domain-containing protein n=1 Tax=Cylindrobasidium torrendii FP15055 ss-10 TaxID=1314674 RepID=A0A0D7BBQ2_9AGAR|nr:Dbl homology domain-containing protein [Cylindrobasidium torrendii FP15055 ss-10]